MKIRFKIILLAIVAFGLVSYGYCEIIDFGDYRNFYKEDLSQKDLNIGLVAEKFDKIKDNKCTRTEQGDYFLIKPICFLDNNLPSLGFKESIDVIFNSIDSFAEIYNTTDPNFYYEGTSPIFSNASEMSISYQFQSEFKKRIIIAQLESKGYLINMHKKYIARNDIKKYSFFVVGKSLVGIGNCSLKNYKNSVDQVDNLYLKNGEIFNLNFAISNIDGYCKGSGPQDLSFYGGACGAAGQLFRVSLITPGITVVKRANHNKWRVRYYGEYAFGDDAAVYEMDKQLEIQNNSGSPVYFRLIDKGEYTYLVGILPIKTNKSVNISKKELGELRSQVIKQTIDLGTNETIDTQIFNSTYQQKFYGGV